MAANATVDGPMDDNARKTAHDALGVEIYPGTEIMTDGTVSIITARKIFSRPECKTDQHSRKRTPQAHRQTRFNPPTKQRPKRPSQLESNLEMASHELNGPINFQLRFQPSIPLPPSPILHGILQLNSPGGYQLHRRLSPRARLHKLHLDSAFPWVRSSTCRYRYHTHHYGFVHLACQSDDVQFFPWFGRSLRNWFVAGRDTGSCNYCGHCIPP
jgi:hypothetical protein